MASSPHTEPGNRALPRRCFAGRRAWRTRARRIGTRHRGPWRHATSRRPASPVSSTVANSGASVLSGRIHSIRALWKEQILARERSAQFGFEQVGRDQASKFIQAARVGRRARFIEGNGGQNRGVDICDAHSPRSVRNLARAPGRRSTGWNIRLGMAGRTREPLRSRSFRRSSSVAAAVLSNGCYRRYETVPAFAHPTNDLGKPRLCFVDRVVERHAVILASQTSHDNPIGICIGPLTRFSSPRGETCRLDFSFAAKVLVRVKLTRRSVVLLAGLRTSSLVRVAPGEFSHQAVFSMAQFG